MCVSELPYSSICPCYCPSHPPLAQKVDKLLLVVPLDDDVLGQRVDGDVLVLFRQPCTQLVPQRIRVARDLAHGGEVQVAAALVVGVDGQILALGARNVVARRRLGELRLCGWCEGDRLGCSRGRLEGAGLGGRNVCGTQGVWGARLRAVGLGDGLDGGQVGGAPGRGRWWCGGRGGGVAGAAADGSAGGGEGAQERRRGQYP